MTEKCEIDGCAKNARFKIKKKCIFDHEIKVCRKHLDKEYIEFAEESIWGKIEIKRI